MNNGLNKKALVYGIIILFIGASVIPSIVGEGEMYFYANQDIPVRCRSCSPLFDWVGETVAQGCAPASAPFDI